VTILTNCLWDVDDNDDDHDGDGDGDDDDRVVGVVGDDGVGGGVWSVKDYCQARHHEKLCKHRVAFLFALIILRDHAADCDETTKAPRRFRRKGLSRYTIVVDDKEMKDSVWYKDSRIGWSWKDIVDALSTEVPTHRLTSAGGKRKVVVTERSPVKKKKKRKLYCYCQQPFDKESGREMVECSGKTSSCKGGWYHLDCLERKEEVLFERTSRNGVKGDVVCRMCQTELALKK